MVPELISHPIKNIDNGIESSNGSLGHGLSYGAGVAQAKKIKELGGSVFILMGDGECAEGSIWEAANLCSDLEIKSITAVIDCNSYQSDTCVSQSNSAEVLRKSGVPLDGMLLYVMGMTLIQLTKRLA